MLSRRTAAAMMIQIVRGWMPSISQDFDPESKHLGFAESTALDKLYCSKEAPNFQPRVAR
eukprot:1693418-Amphidinium_carterae.1